LPVQVMGEAGADNLRRNRGSSGDGIQDHGNNYPLELRRNHFVAGRLQLKEFKKRNAAIKIRGRLLRTRRKAEIDGQNRTGVPARTTVSKNKYLK